MHWVQTDLGAWRFREDGGELRLSQGVMPAHYFKTWINHQEGQSFGPGELPQLVGRRLPAQLEDPGPASGFENPDHFLDATGAIGPDV